MRLISCHIDGFGRLKDEDISFDEGLNVLCRENGWGKTSLAAFIRAMFYGLEGDRRRSLEENERKRYRPWDGGTFGGQLVFEYRNKRYRIFRVFYERESGDAFMLRDEETGLVSADLTAVAGREIFGVDRNSFMKTVFTGQRDRASGPTDDINAMISRLSDMTGDMDSYESADARLKSVLNSMAPGRSTGSISRRKQEIMKLERSVREGRDHEEAFIKCRQELSDCEHECAALREKQRQLGRLQVRAASAERSAAVRAESLRLEKAADDRRRELEGLEKLYDIGGPALSELTQAWERRKAIAGGIRARQEAMAAMEASGNHAGKGAAQRTARLSAIFGILFLAAGVLLAFALPQAAAAAAAAGLILVLISILSGSSGTAGSEAAGRAEKPGTEGSREGLERDIGSVKETDRYFAELLESRGMSFSEENVDRLLYELMSGNMIIERVRSELRKAEDEMEEFRERNARALKKCAEGTGSDAGIPPADRISRAMLVLSEKLENAGQRAMQCRNRLDLLQENLKGWQEDKASLERLQVCQEEEERKYRLVSAAREKLAQAKQIMVSRYSDPVLEGFRRYFSVVTGKPADSFFVDAGLSVTYEECGMPRPEASLSAGMRDLAAFCLRLGLTDAMYPDEKPPLLIDDAFSDYDDENIKGAARLLNELAKDYQIIYLTCSGSRDMSKVNTAS